MKIITHSLNLGQRPEGNNIVGYVSYSEDIKEVDGKYTIGDKSFDDVEAVRKYIKDNS